MFNIFTSADPGKPAAILLNGISYRRLKTDTFDYGLARFGKQQRPYTRTGY